MVRIDGFKVEDHDPTMGFELLPSGWYKCIIVTSDYLNNKAGTGSFYKYQFEVIEGKYKKRQLFEYLSTDYPSNKEVEAWAKGAMSSIFHAVERLNAQDTTELHNIPLMVHVSQEKKDKKDPSSEAERVNNIKDHKSLAKFNKAADQGSLPPSDDDIPF